MKDAFAGYLRKLREIPLADHTEHTGRAALEALLNHFAAQASPKPVVQREPKRVAGSGAPDFKVLRPTGPGRKARKASSSAGKPGSRTFRGPQAAMKRSGGPFLVRDALSPGEAPGGLIGGPKREM